MLVKRAEADIAKDKYSFDMRRKGNL